MIAPKKHAATGAAAAPIASASNRRATRSIALLRRPWLKLVLVALASTPLAGYGQSPDLRLPVNLDADSFDYDGKNSMLVFRGLRLSQGSMGIQADEGRTSDQDFEDSVWHLTGNVIIDVENGHIESESADLEFERNQLAFATISGAPATFEITRPDTDAVTYAEAGRLEYDFPAGTVKFSEQALIIEGCNQISSNYLVYNIKEQRINAQSTGSGDEKVKITYTPREAGTAASCDNARPNKANGKPQDDRPPR